MSYSKSEKALVEINEDFLDILSGRQQVHDYSMSWEPGTDVESARLRTQVALAITIVHEFAHAIWFCINKKYKVDPYLRGHFINELGFELEHMLFSGLIMPIGTPAVEAAPYGFKIDRFPEAGIRDDEETRVFSRAFGFGMENRMVASSLDEMGQQSVHSRQMGGSRSTRPFRTQAPEKNRVFS